MESTYSSWVEGARLSNLGGMPLTPVSRFDIIMSQESRTCVSTATTFPRQYIVQRLVDKSAEYDYHDHQDTYVWDFGGSRERAYLHDTLHRLTFLAFEPSLLNKIPP